MRSPALLVMCLPLICLTTSAQPQTADVRTGTAAFGDWQDDAPGVRRHHPAVRPAGRRRPARTTRHRTSGAREGGRSRRRVPCRRCRTASRCEVFASGLEPAAHHARRAERGHLPVGERQRARARCFRRAPGGAPAQARGLRREPGPALRHRLPAARQIRSTSTWRRRTRWSAIPIAAATPRRRGRPRWSSEHPDQAALDARSGDLPGRQAPVRRGRLGAPISPATCPTCTPEQIRRVREDARPRRRLGRGGEPRRGARVRSGGEADSQLRHRPAQLLGPGDAARHRQPVVRGERARPPRPDTCRRTT